MRTPLAPDTVMDLIDAAELGCLGGQRRRCFGSVFRQFPRIRPEMLDFNCMYAPTRRGMCKTFSSRPPTSILILCFTVYASVLPAELALPYRRGGIGETRRHTSPAMSYAYMAQLDIHPVDSDRKAAISTFETLPFDPLFVELRLVSRICRCPA